MAATGTGRSYLESIRLYGRRYPDAGYGGVPETIRTKPFHQKVDDEIVKFTGFTSFHDLSDQTDPVILTG